MTISKPTVGATGWNTNVDAVIDAVNTLTGDVSTLSGAGALTGVLNVKTDFGALGDDVDDSAALTAAAAAVTAHTVLYFPPGKYRFKTQSPATDAAILINGVSDVGLWFAPGAEIVMDNLSAGAGTSHGIYVKGACSNVYIVGATVRWASAPSSRSHGEAFRFLGYPSDSAPDVTWTTTTGPVSNVALIDCTAVKAPQCGAIFMGCSDIRVVNFRSDNTRADALHFNACRRANVNGHTAKWDSAIGDDGLAFVTYYHASTLWQGVNGPFNQPSLGDWSNTNSQATGVVIEGGLADGCRISGSLDVAVSDLTVRGKTSSGIVIDAAIVGSGVSWAYQASRGITLSNIAVDTCAIGFYMPTQNIDSGSTSTFWTFGVRVSGLSIRGCTNWSIRTEGDGSASSIVAGLHLTNVKVVSGSGGGGNGAIAFSSLRESLVDNLWMDTANGASISFLGQDTALSGALSTMTRHNLVIGSVHNAGGKIVLQDLYGVQAARLSSYQSTTDGVQLIRVREATVQSVRVTLANRNNTGTVRALLLQKTSHTKVVESRVEHDSNTTTTWSSMEIGGGDATDPAATSLRVERHTYANTLNQTGNDITVQGGGNGPVDYLYRASWRNSGESTPVWRATTGGTLALLEVPAQLPPPKSAGYYVIGSAGTSTTSNTLGIGTLRLAPVRLYTPVALVALGIDVTVVGDSGSHFRFGIYADDGGGLPGTLILDAGQVAADAVAQPSATIALTLQPGLYWFGGAVQDVVTTQPTIRVLGSGWEPPVPLRVGTSSMPGSIAANCYAQTSVTGALPSPFVLSSTTSPMPRIAYKVA